MSAFPDVEHVGAMNEIDLDEADLVNCECCHFVIPRDETEQAAGQTVCSECASLPLQCGGCARTFEALKLDDESRCEGCQLPDYDLGTERELR